MGKDANKRGDHDEEQKSTETLDLEQKVLNQGNTPQKFRVYWRNLTRRLFGKISS